MFLMVPGGVFLTSISYWGNPNSKVRKVVDMIYVKSAFVYQTYYASTSQFSREYYLLSLITILCYPASWYLYQTKKMWASVYMHAFMHFLANCACILLYAGIPLAEEVPKIYLPNG